MQMRRPARDIPQATSEHDLANGLQGNLPLFSDWGATKKRLSAKA